MGRKYRANKMAMLSDRKTQGECNQNPGRKKKRKKSKKKKTKKKGSESPVQTISD